MHRYLLGLASLSQTCQALCPPKTALCSSLTVSAPEGASLINITATERHGVTYEGVAGSVDICNVEVYLTHGDAGDAVRFAVWLPLTGWNGRWQGTGGGGFIAGFFDSALLPAVATGYAAGSTDAGVNLEGDPRDWANSPHLVENFVLGKQLSEKFYGRKPKYSYWNGCSTGGRQGMSEAQRYPADYDGIVAGAPGINWSRLIPTMFWPAVLQKPAPVSMCRLAFIGNASVRACGGVDGLIANPLECDFDAANLVGEEVPAGCLGEDGTEKKEKKITKRDVQVWTGIREGFKDKEGKRLWYGLEPGADYSFLAGPGSIPPPKYWIADFLRGDPDYNVSSIGQDELVDLFHESVDKFGPLWGTDDPDLGAFKARGGKILTWHGWADELVFPQGTLDYWRRVVDAQGGEEEVDEFYRVFMAPGLGHCGGGPGPQPPADPVAALVEWVENGKAPDTVAFSGNGMSRDVCKYPAQLKYKGKGDVTKAASWECV